MTEKKTAKVESLQELKKHHLPAREKLTVKEMRKIKKYLRQKQNDTEKTERVCDRDLLS